MTIIPDWVNDFIEVPFRDFGRGLDGADCWGLVRMIWKDRAGLDLPDWPVDPNAGNLVETSMNEELPNWLPILAGTEQELDGVTMTGIYGCGRQMKRANMHIGLVVAPGWLIHTTAETATSCLVRYRERPVADTVTGFWRHRSLA